MSPSTAFVVSTKRGSQGWGRGSLAVCLWRSRRGVARRTNSAAAPNTYSDSHDASPKGRRWVGTEYPTGPDTHSYPRSRPFKAAGSPTEVDVPFVAARDAGQTSRSRPRWRGGGERVSATHQRRSSSSRRLCRAYSWTWPHGHEPVSRLPVRPRHRVFQSRDHIASSPSRGLPSLYS